MPSLTKWAGIFMAPDHFIAPHYLISYRPPFAGAPHVAGGEYGTFPVIGAASSVGAVGEAQAELDETGEGDMMRFLERLSKYGGYCAAARGFAYDCEKCTLISAMNGRTQQVTSFSWTTPGTRALMCNFFSSVERVWDAVIAAACSDLNVELPHFSTGDLHGNAPAQCILGSGASARVLKVRRVGAGEGQEEVALKVVQGREECRELTDEFFLLSELPFTSVECVVGVSGCLWARKICFQSANRASYVLAAAFLMPIVGEPFARVEEVNYVHGPRILESLSDLHEAEVVHNDARYTNVVVARRSASGRTLRSDMRPRARCGRQRGRRRNGRISCVLDLVSTYLMNVFTS
jgi:hypothetical protein